MQSDTGKADRASESGLNNMDRESTSGIETEMGIALPRGFDKPSGDQYLQAETVPIQEREMGDPLGVVGDANITTDDAPSGHNSKPNPQIDSGDSEEEIEQRDDMEVRTLRSNEAGTGTRSHMQHRHNGSLVKHRGDTEASAQLEHDITTGNVVMGSDTHTQEETGRIEILAGESEGRGHSIVETEENSWQNTKDSPDALMLVEEKQGKVNRPNGETIATDTGANNTNALRTVMDTEADETNADTGMRTQIGMFRPIRMDHTNCLQVAIKSIQFKTTGHQKVD